MAIAIPQYKLAYTPIPKVACTSIKTAWYGLKFGRPFDRSHLRVRLRGGRVHGVFPSRRFRAGQLARLQGYWKFAVVRDPASRILSAYSSKILRRDMLTLAATRDSTRRQTLLGRTRIVLRRALGEAPIPAGLPLIPSVDEFVLRLDDYRAASKVIRSHTELTGYYLGPDLAAFDAIYRLEQLPELEAEISARSGRHFEVPNRNISPDALKVTVDDLSPEAFDILMTRLAPDYDLLKEVYPRPTRGQPDLNQTGTDPNGHSR